MRFVYCAVLLSLCFRLSAQKEVNVWYFGLGAGIDFNASPPIVLTDGKLHTDEGCASICDAYGKLLFYTDGDTVYNAKHQVMVNGTGLHGAWSSAQSAMIIKLPKSDSLYLIFNPGEAGGTKKGFYYSVVNVNARGGSGEVITKNVKLKDNMHTESVSAVRHFNGNDCWVVFKNDNSDEFVSYLVTPLGVSNTMTFSQPGPTIGTGINGYTLASKFSPSGKKYALCVRDKGLCLYDFDNKTGYLSNLKIIPVRYSYGVEFSPDEKQLYVSSLFDGIMQYDITSNDLNSILNSAYRVTDTSIFATVQLAPDKKIYIARYLSKYLSVINSPNSAKGACNFQENALYLKGRTCRLGLPPFISTYFSDSIKSSITAKGLCAGDNFSFECADLKTTDSVRWDFGDTASGTDNFSSLQKPLHKFAKPGLYTVKVEVHRKNVNNNYAPAGILTTKLTVVDFLGKANEYPLNLTKCVGDSVLLNPQNPSILSKVLWSDLSGSTLSRYALNGGKYVAAVYRTGANCFYRDTVTVSDIPYATVPDLGKDTMYCLPFGQPPAITLGNQFSNAYGYEWNTGETTKTIQVTKAGTYSVTASGNNECPSSDTVDISFSQLPSYVRLEDDTFCRSNDVKVLQLSVKGIGSVQWTNGDTGRSVKIPASGKYAYTVSNVCGTLRDSFNILLLDVPVVDLGPNRKVCSPRGFALKSNVSGAFYHWEPGGEITESITTYHSGWITLRVTNAGGCSGEDGIFLTDSCEETCFVPNAFSPNDDRLNDVFRPVGNDLRSQGYVFRIFDRWGGLIFETSDLGTGWDGRVNDRICSEGIYFYTVEFVTSKKETIHLAGTFYLVY